MAKRLSKAEKIRRYIRANKNATPKDIAAVFDTTPTHVSVLKWQMRKAGEDLPRVGPAPITAPPKQVAQFKADVAGVKKAKAKKEKKADDWKLIAVHSTSEPTNDLPITMQPTKADAVNDVDAMLAERGKRYGTFLGHAHLTQHLKELITGHARHLNKKFYADEAEALDMICHKLGRIVNGDPHYADSWRDIAGYAKLVADRLETGVQV
jgi:hypothetical protein